MLKDEQSRFCICCTNSVSLACGFLDGQVPIGGWKATQDSYSFGRKRSQDTFMQLW